MSRSLCLSRRLPVLLAVAAFFLTFSPRYSTFASDFSLSTITASTESLAVHSAVAGNITWCVAGSFNGWDNSGTVLNDAGQNGDLFAGDGIHSRTVAIGAGGRHEFKIVECGNWGNAHPPENSWFYTANPVDQVTFTIDTNDRTGDAGAVLYPTQYIVNVQEDELPSLTAVGGFQGWDNTDPTTLMANLGRGVYYLNYTVATPGTYEGKIVRTGSWDEQIGSHGRSVNAPTFNFTTSSADEPVAILFDARSGRATMQPHGSGSANWCVAGDFQGWDNASHPLNDDGAGGDLIGGDGIYSLDVTIAAAGRHGFKVFQCGEWSPGFPNQNSWLNTTSPNQTVKITFDTNDHGGDAGLTLYPTQNIVNAWDDLPASFSGVGDFNGWDNADPALALADRGLGWHTLYHPLPGGHYMGKVTSTGSWDAFGADGRSQDAANVNFQVLVDEVLFALDAYSGRMTIVAPSTTGGAGHDNNIWWDDLGHNSRDPLYRTPPGPVPTGTPVTLRLRAASNDLTAARLRVWDDRNDVQLMLNMTRVADDGQYEWWEATIPAAPAPTIYWYRFIAVDGTATAYYEDDPGRTGGWGQTYGTTPDNSWQLSVYADDFSTPDWVKHAVIYQIFPDRFRDGDPNNNPLAGRFFYGELDGTIYRSDPAGGNLNPWHTPICDPRDPADCPGTYSLNFYGGDLQGVLDKLDYLQDLGVTAVYLNPIFLSPSNHKYDTTDFGVIDPDFGDLAVFEALALGLHNRGMYLILDGVFNHTSSDSVYFDRYSRYDAAGNLTSPGGPGVNDGSGACESPTSPYRDWYYFTNVTPGSGPCAGSDGTPNAAVYESWWGYDSLPKLNAQNPAVKDLFYAGGPNAIGRYWMRSAEAEGADGWRLDVAGDVDPGVTNDPTNLFWEEFRTAVHQTHPDAYIVGEEWGLATAWTLGHEWDATMNYLFGSAIKSFWRDSVFEDNDHNAGSSAGLLAPLTPSQLNARLHNLMERYPPEAFYAMMNLLASHDTNRVLFQLDHNTYQNNAAIYQNPAYDWSDAIERLKGVVMLQMTMPGAPTIYYGDEVGLVGPVYYHNGRWEDDPYNRLPFPWLDETGTPFYTHLQTQAGQDNLRNYYKLLTGARNSHEALRTGSFDTLLVDDENNVYAYGRLLADYSDGAVVVINRAATAQSIVVDVAGYLPVGAQLVDVMDGNAAYSVDGSGQITINDLAGRGGAVLVLDEPMALPPDAVTDLSVTAERSEEVDLAWTAAAGADSYDIYRSLVSGGGYIFVDSTSATTFTDTGLQNGLRYYYVVVSRDDSTLLTSGYSNEANGMPRHDLSSAWFNLQWPEEIAHTISAVTPTENIYAQLWIDGATGPGGPATGIRAQVGWGPVDSTPGETWNWSEMAYHGSAGNNDEYVGNLLPDMVGTFDYVTRWSSDGGATWWYSDLSGPGLNNNPGILYVLASDDTEPPAAPLNLVLVSTSPGNITIAWDANDEPDLAGYELYRENIAEPGFSRIATVGPAVTAYSDDFVVTGETYAYYVVAFDTSFNRSGPSNTVEATAAFRQVTVTWRVTVPEWTDLAGPYTVYVAGDSSAVFGATWNPNAQPLTHVEDDVWEFTTLVNDGTPLEYKYTRGDWERVEWWGTLTGFANREVTIDYGVDGTQLIHDTVYSWRDPLPISHTPADGATGVQRDPVIVMTFSRHLAPETINRNNIVVRRHSTAVPATLTYAHHTAGVDVNATTITVTLRGRLAFNTTYSVTVTGLRGLDNDHVAMRQAYDWSFTTIHPPSAKAATANGEAMTPVDEPYRTQLAADEPTSVTLVSFSGGAATQPWWLVAWPALMFTLTVMSLFGYFFYRRKGVLTHLE
jgi:glycosidase/fibronectin type 3 domain-containing protein